MEQFSLLRKKCLLSKISRVKVTLRLHHRIKDKIKDSKAKVLNQVRVREVRLVRVLHLVKVKVKDSKSKDSKVPAPVKAGGAALAVKAAKKARDTKKSKDHKDHKSK